MPKAHRNPFIPNERKLELDSKNVITEKQSKINYTRQEAKRRTEGAPLKQRKEQQKTTKE